MKDILLVIDLQNAYKSGQPWNCPNIDNVISNTIKVLDSDKTDIAYFTRHIPAPQPTGTWKQYNDHYDIINQSPQLSQLVPEIQPYAARHIVLEKSTYSAVPVLPEALFRSPMPRIIITGVVAHCCVLSTILSLIDKGNKVICLNDAIAAQHHELEEITAAIIETFSPLHTEIMSTESYLLLMEQ